MIEDRVLDALRKALALINTLDQKRHQSQRARMISEVALLRVAFRRFLDGGLDIEILNEELDLLVEMTREIRATTILRDRSVLLLAKQRMLTEEYKILEEAAGSRFEDIMLEMTNVEQTEVH